MCGRPASPASAREARNVQPRRVVEEGAEIADHLLTICIRALDYTPPVDLEFADFLAAVLTADAELFPDDGKYGFRHHLREGFGFFGIHSPTPRPRGRGCGCRRRPAHYDRNHLESLLRDKRRGLPLPLGESRGARDRRAGAYIEVLSVRPCIATGPDGFFLRETVAKYIQLLTGCGAEAGASLGLRVPGGMAARARISLYGGGDADLRRISASSNITSRNVPPKQQMRLELPGGAWPISIRTTAQLRPARRRAGALAAIADSRAGQSE